MLRLVTILLIVLYMLADAEGGKCKLSGKKLKKVSKFFEKKCLKKGFESTLAGCESKGDPTKLKKKNIKKCGKNEKRLAACDFTCQIDGGWSDYGDWSACSAECGGGEQSRERQCNNPAPQKGGADCEGESSETRSCNEQACPVDGGWGDWTDWSECSAECDGGTQTRSKKCNNPAPANGGADCEGEDTETRECNTQSCVGKCPSTHPYVYYNGEYCCKTNKEKVHEPQGEKCDGSEIQKDSLCCENDGYTACPTDECASSAPEANVYRITHTTGTGKYDSGQTSGGYLFTIIGADGETGEHDCAADRTGGVTASCSFKDAAQIGKVKGMRVKNLSDNQWVFVKASVEINGVLRGRWRGSKTIEDYATRAIVFAYIGDEEVEYEITHVTGTGKWDEGARTGQYLFTFKGAGNPFFTEWQDCDANRTHGATGTCIIRDAAELGKLEKVGIKNLGTNSWTFKKFVVKVNGEVVAKWSGTKTVPDKQTVWTVFQ